MKLYTEEQVRDCLNHFVSDDAAKAIINTQTPIELPSDEVTYKVMTDFKINDFAQIAAFNAGVNWIKNKIINQIK